MMAFLDSCVLFLKHSDRLIGFPLVVGGLGLMLFGWRMWKVCVILSFGAIGAALGAYYAGRHGHQLSFAIAGGVLFALASFWPAKYAVALLGGLIGAGLVTYSVSNMNLTAGAVWGAGGAAMLVCTAYAFINRQHVVIMVTAFLGSVLLVAGLSAWVMASPQLFGSIRSVTSGSMALPFLLIVPTVMSSFYQVAEVNRTDVEL